MTAGASEPARARGYLIYAQGIPAFDYEIGVTMGTQEPAETVTEVGTAFWYGFALGDLLTYIPLLAVGLIGHAGRRIWGVVVLAAAAGITVYWPAVCLVALVDARDATGWRIADEIPYWIALPLIAAWGALVLFLLASGRRDVSRPEPTQPVRRS